MSGVAKNEANVLIADDKAKYDRQWKVISQVFPNDLDVLETMVAGIARPSESPTQLSHSRGKLKGVALYRKLYDLCRTLNPIVQSKMRSWVTDAVPEPAAIPLVATTVLE